MDEPSRVRSFQFSLRALLLVVLLVVLGMVFGQERLRRERLEAEVTQLAAQVKALEAQNATLSARAQAIAGRGPSRREEPIRRETSFSPKRVRSAFWNRIAAHDAPCDIESRLNHRSRRGCGAREGTWDVMYAAGQW